MTIYVYDNLLCIFEMVERLTYTINIKRTGTLEKPYLNLDYDGKRIRIFGPVLVKLHEEMLAYHEQMLRKHNITHERFVEIQREKGDVRFVQKEGS